MGVLVESQFPRVASLKRCCGFLSTGAQHMLPQSYPNYKTVHRRFQSWCRDEVLCRVLTDVANELRDRGTLDEEECFIDTTFVTAIGGGAEVATTKRGKGMKIMAIVDRHGLPLATKSASRPTQCSVRSASAFAMFDQSRHPRFAVHSTGGRYLVFRGGVQVRLK